MPITLYPRWMYSSDYDPKAQPPVGVQLVKTPAQYEALLADGWKTNPDEALGKVSKGTYAADDDFWPGDVPKGQALNYVPKSFPAIVYSEDYNRMTGVGALKVKTEAELIDALASGYLPEPPSLASQQQRAVRTGAGLHSVTTVDPKHPATSVEKPKKDPEPPPRGVNDFFDPTTKTAAEVVTLVEEMTDANVLDAVLQVENTRDRKVGGPRRSIQKAITAKLETISGERTADPLPVVVPAGDVVVGGSATPAATPEPDRSGIPNDVFDDDPTPRTFE